MRKICPNCGAETPDNQSVFCHMCGSRLDVTRQIPSIPTSPLTTNHSKIRYYKNPAYDKRQDRPDPGVFAKIVFLGIATLIIYIVCDPISTGFILYGNSINQLSSFSTTPDVVNHFGDLYVGIGWIIKILPFIAFIILAVLVFYKPQTINERP